jgi:LPXTG-site transpeptidase (sortase) family protein
LAPKGRFQEAGVNSLRRIRAALGPRRLVLASVLLVASLVLLAAGIGGMLLTGDGDDGTKLTNEGVPGPIGTATATIVATQPPSNAPVARLIIEKIGVDAPVITLGVDENFIPEVPDNPNDVAWYNWSALPGHGSNAVLAGHFDWTVNGQPVIGVFYYLADLSVGDIIEVKLEDGTDYKYSVVGNLAVANDDSEAMELMAPTPSDMVTLITCGGVWTPNPNNPLGGEYTHRQVVRAELIGGEPTPQPDDGNIGEPRQEDSQG